MDIDDRYNSSDTPGSRSSSDETPHGAGAGSEAMTLLRGALAEELGEGLCSHVKERVFSELKTFIFAVFVAIMLIESWSFPDWHWEQAAVVAILYLLAYKLIATIIKI